MDQPISAQPKRAVPDFSLSDREKNVIIAGSLLSMLLAALDQTIVAPALPTIASSLGHAEYLSWIVTAYLLTATAVSPLYGKLSDIYGRRAIMFAAIFIFLAGSVMCALAPNMLVLIAGRAVQGLGGGGLFALTQTVIGDLVPPLERARYAAWISGTWAVASIAGPLLGGAFAEHLHWSLIFWINLPLGLLAVAVINKPLRKLAIAGTSHKVDGWGAILMVIATFMLLLAVNWGGNRYAWSDPQIIGLLAGSAIFWLLFCLRLRTAEEPLVSLEVLSNRIVLTGTFTMFLLQGGSIGLAVYLPVYMQATLGMSPGDTGLAMLGLLLGTVVGAGTSGRLVPRVVNYKRIAFFGISASIVGLGVLAYIADTAHLLEIEIATAIIGAGIGTIFPVSTISVQNAVERKDLGVATGLLTFLRSLGGAIGVAAIGAIALGNNLPLAGEGVAATAASGPHGSFSIIFLAAAAMLLAALIVYAFMPQKALRGSVPTETPIMPE
ncbi:MDR family MFS transporter [Aquamicrobium lusatiense]|uniref:MDR family MFS transporter n=1 Tax=Aquamicrobium lusatiense TaxID=89772 RepID=UPI002453E37D|nr:MDR family MFS transporter [Aquamicrobium lusatiense]MDH4990326.1 MDR family MFS transporter [Aquamicrobium lusatiense]